MSSSPSKAWFRATRERVGLTQKAMAERLGVLVDTVKKWENPKYYAVPDDATAFLSEALSAHVSAGGAAVEAVMAQSEEQGDQESVSLLYYRSQRQYDEYGRDPGDYAVIDARCREIAATLETGGISVEYRYPEESDERMFTALANTRSKEKR